MTSRIDLRSIAEAIAEHADAITAYASDPNVSQDVVNAEALGRAYLIEARLGRLRQAVHAEVEIPAGVALANEIRRIARSDEDAA